MLNFFFMLVFISGYSLILGQSKTLEDFESADGWSIIKSDGAVASISVEKGVDGNSIALHYEFIKGTGYCGIQKKIVQRLPANYHFQYMLRGESTDNNLEVKFLDSSRNNVWWHIKRNYSFPKEWKQISTKKRNIEFAWGPADNKNLQDVAYMEFTISSANGGKGTIYFDNLMFEELAVSSVSYTKSKAIQFFGSNKRTLIPALLDNNPLTTWRSRKGAKEDFIIIDLGMKREIGGFIINWGKHKPKRLLVFLTSKLLDYPPPVKDVAASINSANFISLPEAEARFIKLVFTGIDPRVPVEIKDIELKDASFSATPNDFYFTIAQQSPRGDYPRYFSHEASFWTINGVDSDDNEALFSMDGAVEPVRGGYSVEPFISEGRQFYTWADVKKTTSLRDGYLPIPKVTWHTKNIQLDIEVFSAGKANVSSTLYAKYSITNVSSMPVKGKLWLAIRPFQVNPHYQWLNLVGGFAKFNAIEQRKSALIIDDKNYLYPLPNEYRFGQIGFDEGNIVSFMKRDMTEKSNSRTYEQIEGYIEYPYSIPTGEKKDVYVVFPYYNSNRLPLDYIPFDSAVIEKLLRETIQYWREKLERVEIQVPESGKRVVESIRSNLAYILINKDKDALQPGSRSYDRSWIRDGAMISASLLQMGLTEEVKKYIEWYAPYQFEDGKVPCVVDRRGPDPVPENDSQGELIYLISQYFKFTHDTAIVKKYYPNIKQAVAYNLAMTGQRKTDEYKNGSDSMKSFYGLLLESISHEGYSDKPRHSYWDNFFALRGFKDAAELAEIIGEKEDAKNFAVIRDDFRKNFYNSIALTAKRTKTDYIAGCAELGDFDATSTSIVNYLCAEQEYLDSALLHNTFNRYYQYFTDRKAKKTASVNYTPYEVRLINTFIHLGEKDRALDLLDFFLNDQRPHGFRHWAEVVWEDSTADKFIGDMPHSWIGGDFIASARSMFIYENEYENAFTLAAGLPEKWVSEENGVSVKNMPVYTGKISYSYRKKGNSYFVDISGTTDQKNPLLYVANVSGQMPQSVIVNGKPAKNFDKRFITVQGLPATVEIVF